MNNKYISLLQLAGCVIFLAQPFIFRTHPPGEGPFSFSRPMQRDLLANFLMLLFFYINYYSLVPLLYLKRKYTLYTLSVVAGLLVIVITPSLFTGRFSSAHSPEHARLERPQNMPGRAQPAHSTFMEEINHHIFLFAAVVSFSLLLRIQKQLLEAEKARHESELSTLKTQINPHFLFNTLNSIYALTVKKDEAASDAVINLAGLMRYILKDSHSNKISLRKELDYVESYIELQKSRLRETALIDYRQEGSVDQKEIAPLLLITFIENAFKYGINPDKKSDIKILINVVQQHLQMLVTNKVVADANDGISMGIGISNTKHRLQLLYPGKHDLQIIESGNFYSVVLSINLS